MKIKVISSTPDPMSVISQCAGTSYGKTDNKASRVVNCYKAGHMSVFEHATITFRIEGISRACSHQLVRHRLASFVQESQRYCKIDTSTKDWYVTPECFEGMWMYQYAMAQAGDMYVQVVESGIKPEDARYLLPEATKTNITMTMNVRELFSFLDLRTDSHAQWEIREMAQRIVEVASDVDDQWRDLIGLWTGVRQ